LEKGTGRKSKKPPGFATKGMQIIARLEVTGGTGSICLERYEDYAQMVSSNMMMKLDVRNANEVLGTVYAERPGHDYRYW
jgi:hypothetical protein